MNEYMLFADVNPAIYKYFEDAARKNRVDIFDLFSEWVDSHFTNMIDGGTCRGI